MKVNQNMSKSTSHRDNETAKAADKPKADARKKAATNTNGSNGSSNHVNDGVSHSRKPTKVARSDGNSPSVLDSDSLFDPGTEQGLGQSSPGMDMDIAGLDDLDVTERFDLA